MEKSVQDDWVINVNIKLNQMEDSSVAQMEQCWKKRSIYRLPTSFTELNKRAYKPQVVSLGPYHYGQPHLKPMEAHKERAFLFFMKRSNKPLECYIEELAPIVQDLKDSYDSLDMAWQQDTKAFLKLMILDGCFLLEILRMSASFNRHKRYTWPGTSSSSANLDNNVDYAPNDPIFSQHGDLHLKPYIRRDMLMLENQLPMLLLRNLLAIQNDRTILVTFTTHYHKIINHVPCLDQDYGDTILHMQQIL